MNIVNLTPHELTIVNSDAVVALRIPASGQVARCAQITVTDKPVVVNGVQITTGVNSFGEVQGLPDQTKDTLFFVSALVAAAAWKAGRDDVVCPLSAVRDSEGRIIGTSGLARMPR